MAYQQPTPEQLIQSWESAIARLQEVYKTANKGMRLRLTAQIRSYRNAIENTRKGNQ